MQTPNEQDGERGLEGSMWGGVGSRELRGVLAAEAGRSDGSEGDRAGRTPGPHCGACAAQTWSDVHARQEGSVPNDLEATTSGHHDGVDVTPDLVAAWLEEIGPGGRSELRRVLLAPPSVRADLIRRLFERRGAEALLGHLDWDIEACRRVTPRHPPTRDGVRGAAETGGTIPSNRVQSP